MIVVFGAIGFIGTYLVDALASNNVSVLAVDIDRVGNTYYKARKIPFMHMDITESKDFEKLPSRNVSCVINLACLQPANVSLSAFDPVNYIRVNTIGPLNIIKYCMKNNISKFLHIISHRSIIKLSRSGRAITEDETHAIEYDSDFSIYSISESAALDCINYYRKRNGLCGIIFRLPNVFGYGPHFEGYKNGKYIKTGFQTFIDNASEGKPIEVWGDCNVGRDIVYVKDVVSAIILAIGSNSAVGLYNISSGRKLTLDEEAKEIINVFSPENKPSTIIYRDEIPNSVEQCFYCITKAEKDFGWKPKYSFKDMLIDYKLEMLSGRFKFLLDKRRNIMKGESK